MKLEKVIANEPIENAIVITKDGEIFRCFGNLNAVYPNVDLGKRLYGADVTHNHPIGSDNEYTFSEDDVDLFMIIIWITLSCIMQSKNYLHAKER